MTRYGKWTIYYDPPPIPIRCCDWHFYHDDYDGAPIHSESNDCPDKRCGDAGSEAECLALIAEIEAEACR